MGIQRLPLMGIQRLWSLAWGCSSRCYGAIGSGEAELTGRAGHSGAVLVFSPCPLQAFVGLPPRSTVRFTLYQEHQDCVGSSPHAAASAAAAVQMASKELSPQQDGALM